MKNMRRNIPRSIRSKYNFGYAEVDIEGITKTKYCAHSGIKNLDSLDNLTLTTEQKAKLSNISVEPSEANVKFSTLNVNRQNIVDGDGAWNRRCDSEFKILNEIAMGLGDNVNVNGSIKLYSDLDCCPSCKGVIEQFQTKYPNIDIEVLYKTVGGD